MAATKSSDGRVKKVMMIDAKKAHISIRFARRTSSPVAHGSGSRAGSVLEDELSGCAVSARRRRRGKMKMSTS